MEVIVRRREISALPDLASLGGYGDYREIGTRSYGLMDKLNTMFGDNSYFGSDYDRYNGVFRNSMGFFSSRLESAERDLRLSISAVSDLNAYRPCNTEEALRNIPPCMIDPITFGTNVFDLQCQHKVQGWVDYSDDEIRDKRKRWKRLLNQNGVNRYDPDVSKRDKPSKFRIIHDSEDPRLTFQDIDDINETREYVEWVLKNTDMDPTSLDDIRT